ncbi:hypothetical protein PCASD_25674 [Puccinia coronata f. sp. avenae]|uniref:Mitochondrial import inner membrane translocase subunit TIM9 n=1 Tax=Puccinia coronata f. sp. avenae TaxID=200324 RepID=A0A2N5S1Y0_9BASI|nr:hypothetical protein PCASD_25674 [Puccinia coronata f. sp. avenae]
MCAVRPRPGCCAGSRAAHCGARAPTDRAVNPTGIQVFRLSDLNRLKPIRTHRFNSYHTHLSEVQDGRFISQLAGLSPFESPYRTEADEGFLKLYSSLVERCFTSCCQDFTSRALSSKEESCVNNCADKFLKHSERVGARFSEHNAEMMQKRS